jgi:hypothetical protein
MSGQLLSPKLLLFLTLIPFLTVFAAGPRKHYGQGFSIDLDEPYDRVAKVVQTVSEDNIIRGSSEYKGTNDLYGANPARKSGAFHGTPTGTVFYKERPGTIAPDHFYGSNDQGTLTVRYVVSSLGPKSTRVQIDAIFVEDNHHHFHASDGTVENAEFLAISDEIKDIDDQEFKARQDAAVAKQQETISSLQAELDKNNEALKALQHQENSLQQQLKAAPRGPAAKVRTASADLKSEPYNGSATLQTLAQGAPVTVLQKIQSWYHVESSTGQSGWVYALMLEAGQ